jgi:hypothetical protein
MRYRGQTQSEREAAHVAHGHEVEHHRGDQVHGLGGDHGLMAGLIVSIGMAADSFIVYFERIRDEIRIGRTIPAAIDHGWK